MPSENNDKVILSECEYTTFPQELTASDVLTYYGHLRAYIQHEDGLINSRLTWSFTVHGALFAVYGVLWSKVAELFIRLNQSYPTPAEAHAAHLSDPALSKVIFLLLLAQVPIAFLGAIVGHYSRTAIKAAHRAIQHLDAIAQASPAINGSGPASALLPRITRGGASPSKTDSARLYYFLLPAGAIGVWIGLAALSIAAAFFALFNNPA